MTKAAHGSVSSAARSLSAIMARVVSRHGISVLYSANVTASLKITSHLSSRFPEPLRALEIFVAEVSRRVTSSPFAIVATAVANALTHALQAQ